MSDWEKYFLTDRYPIHNTLTGSSSVRLLSAIESNVTNFQIGWGNVQLNIHNDKIGTQFYQKSYQPIPAVVAKPLPYDSNTMKYHCFPCQTKLIPSHLSTHIIMRITNCLANLDIKQTFFLNRYVFLPKFILNSLHGVFHIPVNNIPSCDRATHYFAPSKILLFNNFYNSLRKESVHLPLGVIARTSFNAFVRNQIKIGLA